MARPGQGQPDGRRCLWSVNDRGWYVMTGCYCFTTCAYLVHRSSALSYAAAPVSHLHVLPCSAWSQPRTAHSHVMAPSLPCWQSCLPRWQQAAPSGCSFAAAWRCRWIGLGSCVPSTCEGKTSESVHCTILNKLCACQRMRHRPSARPLYRFGRLAHARRRFIAAWMWCDASKQITVKVSTM